MRGVAIALGIVCVAWAWAQGAASDLSEAIRVQIESAESGPIAGRPVNRVFLRAVYGPRAWEPLWLTGEDPMARVRSILASLERSGDEGLRPESYHLKALRERLDASDVTPRAELEILLTDAVGRLAVHLQAGALPGRARGPEVDFPRRPVDAVAIVTQVAASPDVQASLAALAPVTPGYIALRGALATYRKMAAGGGWKKVPPGPKLVPGQVDPRVPALRRRLVASGDLAAPAGSQSRFTPEVVAAVRRFQGRHGLKVDGIVGKDTVEALNVPVELRVGQIGANLERLRWLPDEPVGRRVEVNIPAFTIEGHDPAGEAFSAAVVVGTPENRTPEFSSGIARVIFNPRWTVPASIAKKELLPKEAATPGHLAQQGIRALPDGRLRQAPGPQNPLGHVKFEFPNLFGVYLHDTSAQALFGRSNRTLSHGCVRVANAAEFAGWVLRGMPRWSPERVQETVATWETRSATLLEPVPLLLIYRSAWVDRQGEVQFRPDFYGRDEAVVTALLNPPAIDARLSPAPVLPSTPEPVYSGPSGADPSPDPQ